MESDNFTVAVGPPAKLEIEKGTNPSASEKQGGEYFTVTPRLRLLDVGGNFIFYDNTSAALIEIYSNPTNATLLPRSNLFVVANDGLISFTGLKIDKAGRNYRLFFQLFSYSRLSGQYTSTNVVLISEMFDVVVGPPRDFKIVRYADRAWAGNQAFLVQPEVHLVDYGENVVQTDFSSISTAFILPSLSTSKTIIINTTDADTTVVESVSVNKVSGTYGAGEIIDISIKFSAMVFLTSEELPSLRMKVANSNNYNSNVSFAHLTGDTTATILLHFRYVVQENDSTAALDYDGIDALKISNASLVDGNGRLVNASLPVQGLTANASIIIDTSQPFVVSVESNSTNGEYTVGDVISIAIGFNYPIVVEGYPFIYLNAYRNVSPFVQAVATYLGVSDDNKVLNFAYVVDFDDYAERLSIASDQIEFANNVSCNSSTFYYLQTIFQTQRLEVLFANASSNSYDSKSVNITSNTTTISNFTSDYCGIQLSNYPILNSSLWNLGSIKRLSNFPVTTANLSLSQVKANFEINYDIVVNTDAPKLNTSYGLQTSKSSGQYYPGEDIKVTVQFNKPVVAYGNGIFLRLDAGPKLVDGSYSGLAYFERLLDDKKTLEFLYVVEKSVNTSALQLLENKNSLVIARKDAYIKRFSDAPALNADLQTAGLVNASMHILRGIALRGFAPVVLSVSLNSTTPMNRSILYPDDIAVLKIQFSAPVVTTCVPVLVIAAGYHREAIYATGNNTDTFIFQYTVSTGDRADSIMYRDTPNALCPTSSCPHKTSCGIFAKSTTLTQLANLQLLRPTNYLSLKGVTVATLPVYPIPLSRNTTISAISVDVPDGEYGIGSVFEFSVVFTDRVIVKSSQELPKLYLSIEDFAVYSGGSGSSTLKFQYVFNRAVSNGLNFKLYPSVMPNSNSSIICNNTCSLMNFIGRSVCLRSTVAFSSNIILDASAPSVIDVWSTKDSSSEEYFSSGEEILIFVQFNKPVVVVGLDPRIKMHVGSYQKFANYDRIRSNSIENGDILVFVYNTAEGDITNDLTYSEPYIDLREGYGNILRDSSIPTATADVSLPFPANPLRFSGTPINVNTVLVPKVVGVYSISEPAVYYAGDKVVLRVDFSRFVMVNGVSYLVLNVGRNSFHAPCIGYQAISDLDGIITDLPPIDTSNPTKSLFYEYTVESGHFNQHLSYTDRYALILGENAVNDSSFIRHAASFPSLRANLELPTPGEDGSLDANSHIVVDGRIPYVKSLEIAEPSGQYSTRDTITILMNFSAPVAVFGNPYFTLETGRVDGTANYAGGNMTKTLVFVYQPQPGDYTFSLDYRADRKLFNSANFSFEMNGNIFTASANPVQEVNIHLNPPGGVVSGDTSEVAFAGQYTFTQLLITKRGLDYRLRYVSALDGEEIAMTEQLLEVSFSSEYQLLPEEALVGHRIGSSVDLSGDIAAIGAPFSNKSVTSVQSIISTAANCAPQQEVRVIQTLIKPQAAIQQFYTTADVGETIGGFFTIRQDCFGPTQLIPANADESMVESVINFDLSSLGKVIVTREPYIFCACKNAFLWTVTFIDITQGEFFPLVFDTSMLTGQNAQIIGPILVQSPAFMRGTFFIIGLNKQSSAIPFDAGVVEIARAIKEVGLQAVDVLVSSSDKGGGRAWSITFDAYLDSYEVPILYVDGNQLSGGQIEIWIETVRPGCHGPKGIAGYFQLEWRGNTTEKLYANASADDVKNALEKLPVINFVNVNRSLPSPINGYTWTVEFMSVNINSPRGYFTQEISNLEPIETINNLVATNASLSVQARFFIGMDISVADAVRQGTFGERAGAVHLFQRVNESWIQTATVRGNDTDENDLFGTSLALTEDLLLVGAPGSDMNGVPEKQSIFCSADGGFFKIDFRGWSSDAISANVTKKEFTEAITSKIGMFGNLHSVDSIVVDDWGAGGLCSNNTAVITFFSPVDGAKHLFGVDTYADLELLEVINLNLTTSVGSPILQVSEVQKGSWRLRGANADQQQIGSAYVFRLSQNCPLYSPNCLLRNWVQESQFFPTEFQQGSSFGSSVGLSGNIAIVGAPSADLGKGQVYVFEYNLATLRWNYLQVADNPTQQPSSHFGYSLAIFGDTFVVGVPYLDAATGTLYVYKRPSSGGSFIASQTLLPRESMFLLSSYDYYGLSVAIDKNLVVVGAPGYSDSVIHLGRHQQVEVSDSGGVFVFSRTSDALDFEFLEKLQPSNVKEFDRFGHSVAVEENRILASSAEEFIGPLSPAKTIIEVTTFADYNNVAVSGSFRLNWLTENSTTGKIFTTRPIMHDISAPELRHTILEDFPVGGDLLISRSNIDVYNGGYSWQITFSGLTGDVPILSSNPDQLSGTNATVMIEYLSAPPFEVRGIAHIFDRKSASFPFVEQVFLSPYVHQRQDLCGSSTALSRDYALIGCPNRDQHVPNRNSGAAFLYDLNLLNIEFSNSVYEVFEGATAVVQAEHIDDYGFKDAFFSIMTLDRNAAVDTQNFVKDLYDIQVESIEFPKTILDHSGLVGSAIGRTQDYGSSTRESKWVDGVFDYRGISDYVPVKRSSAFLVEDDFSELSVVSNSDNILEKPDEGIKIVLYSPGLWPGVMGSLFTTITLVDNGDGFFVDTQYDKLFDENPRDFANFGFAVDACAQLNIIVSGSPNGSATSSGKASGSVSILKLIGTNWTVIQNIYPPPDDPENSRFGEAVAIMKEVNRNTSIIAIGQPLLNKVYVYVSQGPDVGFNYDLDIVLSDEEANNPSARYGEQGTICFDGSLLIVGAPGIETVFTYTRFFNNSTDRFEWGNMTILRSLDYDYDLLLSLDRPHRQEFGKSVSASLRTIVVGSPYADYDKQASNLIEKDFITEGLSIFSVGKGRAYVFYSIPAVQQIRISASHLITEGEFRVKYNHFGLVETTSPIRFNASFYQMELALEELQNIDDVSVSFSVTLDCDGGGSEYIWQITFLSDWQQPSQLRIEYFGHGCDNCKEFFYPDGNFSYSIDVSEITAIGSLKQIQTLEASDKRSGNKFGYAVSIEKDLIAVGAPYSSSMTATTWDFEVGSLLGWTQTGNAFAYQPTYGDNSYFRKTVDSINPIGSFRGEHSGLTGRYYISTYENRTGDMINIASPSPFAIAGSTQGNAPVGTLTSDVFMIRGSLITFLIGGGCNIYEVYVELIVDGVSVAKVTGKCKVKMSRASFDVAHLRNRAAQIRIVDNSSTDWGHISVDNFEFDWETKGATLRVGNQVFSRGGLIEAYRSGAAYVYRRFSLKDQLSCNDSPLQCKWNEEVKLTASDKRQDSQFGSSVTVSDEFGRIAVGAPYAQLSGIFKDFPSIYPHQDEDGNDLPFGIKFPVDSSRIDLFNSFPTNVPGRSSSNAVWQLQNESNFFADPKANENAGAVYIFIRQPEKLFADGFLASKGDWIPLEQSKLQASDGFANDKFGFSLSMVGSFLAIGSYGNDGIAENAGCLYFYRIGFTSLRFSMVIINPFLLWIY